MLQFPTRSKWLSAELKYECVPAVSGFRTSVEGLGFGHSGTAVSLKHCWIPLYLLVGVAISMEGSGLRAKGLRPSK